MLNIVHFDLDQRVKEIELPQIHPLEYYQHEKSKKHPRKRRAIYPSYMPELRVMRHDIRRRYGEMFVNVTNHHDISLLGKFFGEFCRSDCDVINVTPANNELKRNIDLIFFDGKDRENISLKEFLEIKIASFQMMPDQVSRLLESQVRVRQGTQGSVVMFTILVKGVKVFATYPLHENQRKQVSNCRNKRSNEIENSSFSSSSVSSENDAFEKRCDYSLEIASVPLDTVTGMAIAMVLDENHCIRKLNIEYRCISETPVLFQ